MTNGTGGDDHRTGGDMSSHREGHDRPESGPPGGLVEVLGRWESSGGRWQVLGSTDDWIDIGLFAGDGEEQVTRVTGARTSVLHHFLAGRTASSG
jgi:hypothetical protein